jgi:hypothetical protein
MSNFAIFAFVWPVVGTALLCAFGLFLARRTRILYERTQAAAAQRLGNGPAQGVATVVPRSESIKADA